MGKPQRREREPGRFQSTWPVLEFTQLICKSNTNWSSPPQIIRSGPRGSRACLISWGYPSLCWPPSPSPATHVCFRKTVSKSYRYLRFMWKLPAKDFPLLEERAQSTDGEKEAVRDSGTFPCSNKTPGRWHGSWNLLTTALDYQHASWGRRKSPSPGLSGLSSAPTLLGHRSPVILFSEPQFP